MALTSDPTLGSSFVKALFPVLYELFNSMVCVCVCVCVRVRVRVCVCVMSLHVLGWFVCPQQVPEDHPSHTLSLRVSFSLSLQNYSVYKHTYFTQYTIFHLLLYAALKY